VKPPANSFANKFISAAISMLQFPALPHSTIRMPQFYFDTDVTRDCAAAMFAGEISALLQFVVQFPAA